MNLFPCRVDDWSAWSQIYHSSSVFTPLATAICRREGLPFAALDCCLPGTNAVFRCGSYIVKILAPAESGADPETDCKIEEYGLKRASALGIPVPRLVAAGRFEDRYVFHYLILEYLEGEALSEKLRSGITPAEKRRYGQELRELVDRLQHGPVRKDLFAVDLKNRALNNERWLGFPAAFNRERRQFTAELSWAGETYVHGDLNPDNMILGEDNRLHLIDFADAVIGPPEYELPALFGETFGFDSEFLAGYGRPGDADPVDACFNGLLLHDFGADIIRRQFGPLNDIAHLAALRQKLFQAIGRV